MERTDKAAHSALKKILPDFTDSNISPERLADRLQARDFIGKGAYEAALNKLNLESNRRRELLNEVMGCGKGGAFEGLVHILLEMADWLGENLIGTFTCMYVRAYVQCWNISIVIIVIETSFIAIVVLVYFSKTINNSKMSLAYAPAAAYRSEGGIWTEKAHHTHVSGMLYNYILVCV